MAIAMSVLAVGALFGGLIQIPGVDAVLEHFLEGTFESSPLFHIVPSTAVLVRPADRRRDQHRRDRGRVLLRRQPRVTARLIARVPRLHRFLLSKWYFDELQDALVYRPAIAVGRFANAVFERVVVDGIVNTASGVVQGTRPWCAGRSPASSVPALLLVGGFAALGVYFLVVSS